MGLNQMEKHLSDDNGITFNQQQTYVAKLLYAEKGWDVFFKMDLTEIEHLAFDDRLNTSDLGRMLYMASFVGYWNDETNAAYLRFDNGIRMDKRLLRETMGLDVKAFSRFFDKMITLEIVYITDDGSIAMDERFFFKGNARGKRRDDVTNVSTEVLRGMYEYATHKEHALLGSVVRLASMAHRRENIICENPNTTYSTDIKPISSSMVAKLAGFRSFREFKDAYDQLRFEQRPAFKLFDYMDGDIVALNPYLIYGGNNIDGIMFRDRFDWHTWHYVDEISTDA